MTKFETTLREDFDGLISRTEGDIEGQHFHNS